MLLGWQNKCTKCTAYLTPTWVDKLPSKAHDHRQSLVRTIEEQSSRSSCSPWQAACLSILLPPLHLPDGYLVKLALQLALKPAQQVVRAQQGSSLGRPGRRAPVGACWISAALFALAVAPACWPTMALIHFGFVIKFAH